MRRNIFLISFYYSVRDILQSSFESREHLFALMFVLMRQWSDGRLKFLVLGFGYHCQCQVLIDLPLHFPISAITYIFKLIS